MKLRASVGLAVAVVGSLWALGACSSSDQDGAKVDGSAASAGTGNGASSGSGAGGSSGNGTGAGNGKAGLDLNIGDGGTPNPGPGMGQGGSTEVCDGEDNDGDGETDNIDKDSDGVCDCLLIATLGVKGTSGQGDVFAAWLTARSDNGAADLADQTLTPALLAKYQVIVAQDVHKNHEYSADEVAALEAWVKQGGGFMTLIGYSNAGEAKNVNRLLAPYGMSYTDEQILQKSGNSTIPITNWTPHPIDMGVTQVGVDNGYPVAGMGDVIATGGKWNVASVQEIDKGHVFLWGDEWVTYNSEWNDHPEYQVQLFWLNAIKWLTVRDQCQVVIPPNPPK